MNNSARRESRAPDGAELDPVAAFWLSMARHARTGYLKDLHHYLAVQRADFLAYRREQTGQEQNA